MASSMQISIPFNLTEEEVVLDPAAKGARLGIELEWLFENATEGELPLILTSAACLWEKKQGTIAECLSSAIVWMRG